MLNVNEALIACEKGILSVAEQGLIASVKSRLANHQPITEKQLKWLGDIEMRITSTRSYVNENTNGERIGVTQGMRGWFAVLYDEEGPINSGIGSYATPQGAHEEALEWAQAEGVPCDELKVAA